MSCFFLVMHDYDINEQSVIVVIDGNWVLGRKDAWQFLWVGYGCTQIPVILASSVFIVGKITKKLLSENTTQHDKVVRSTFTRNMTVGLFKRFQLQIFFT